MRIGYPEDRECHGCVRAASMAFLFLLNVLWTIFEKCSKILQFLVKQYAKEQET